jgi:hypothetical protein
VSSFDHAERRRVRRRGGAYRGFLIYIAASEVRAAGYDPDDPDTYYRLFPSERGSYRLQLYRKPNA